MAIVVVDAVAAGTTAQIVAEGEEPSAFWTALNGKAKYDTELNAPGAPILDPRLFHCKLLASGRVRIEQIDNFDQDDLEEDDIMVLDAGDEIYVWEGRYSEPEEKRKTLELVHVRLMQWFCCCHVVIVSFIVISLFIGIASFYR